MSKNTGFGHRVKEARERLSAKRQTVARHAGISAGLLELIEMGQIDDADVGPDRVRRLAEILQCTDDWLRNGEEHALKLPVGIIGQRRHQGAFQGQLDFGMFPCPNCQNPSSGSRCCHCGHPLE